MPATVRRGICSGAAASCRTGSIWKSSCGFGRMPNPAQVAGPLCWKVRAGNPQRRIAEWHYTGEVGQQTVQRDFKAWCVAPIMRNRTSTIAYDLHRLPCRATSESDLLVRTESATGRML